MHDAVREAISIINERYYEPLTLNGLATETFFSPFHFSRLFHKHAGMPPGRYLRVVRLFEAKRLLVTTSLTVADVVTAVGYSSVGTFTTRFTKATGMSPSQFREPGVTDLLAASGPGFRRLPTYELAKFARQDNPAREDGPTGSILGSVRIPAESVPADVLIGVFDSLVPQRAPVACHALGGAGTTVVFIHNVPIGRWHVIGMAMRSVAGMEADTLVLSANRDLTTVVEGQVAVVDLELRPPSPTDPPIAITVAEPRAPGEPADECGGWLAGRDLLVPETR